MNQTIVNSSGNVNTQAYWDGRFGTGDWERRGGLNQSRAFSISQLPHLNIDASFDGALVDFGCGAGDAMPVYRRAFPRASLTGVDFSSRAVELGRRRFGQIAAFVQGDYSDVPKCDVIICSNVMEHLDDDRAAASELIKRCHRLLIVVPFEEREPLCDEHVRSYRLQSFNDFNVVRTAVFPSRGWSEYGFRDRLLGLHVGNLFRRLGGHPAHARKMQILFEILP